MIGKTISHYRILEKLGEGGMGVVYKAEDTRLKRLVALKFLPQDLHKDEQAKKRFFYEAQTASALDNAHIGVIYEIDETKDGRIFIAMAYYQGETLKNMIGRGPLRFQDAIKIAIQIATGLASAHKKDIIHRDIKPANILFTDEGQVKIVDFGLAKFLKGSHLTKTLNISGTLAYMSPEHVQGFGVDRRTDIWSFAIVLYEMLTGKLPFSKEYEQSVIYAILNEEPEPLSDTLSQGFPTESAKLLEKCLAKNAEERYDSMEEVLGDLSYIEKEAGVLDSKITYTLQTREKRSRRSYGLGAAILILIIVAGFFFWSRHETEAERVGITVLPIKSFSDAGEPDWFRESLTDALITDLSRISGLSVTSLSTAMRFKDSDRQIPDIARELDVTYVLESSVIRVGETIRLSVKLIDAKNDMNVWAESFNRSSENVLTLQSELAATIAREVQVQLTSEEEEYLKSSVNLDARAQEAYLKGRYFFSKRSGAGLEAAVKHFQEAIAGEPNYADAHAGLAMAYSMWQRYTGKHDPDIFAKAKEAARTALKLNKHSAEAILALAFATLQGDLFWAGQNLESQFKDAIRLNPSYASAHQYYGWYLIYQGRFEEARAVLARAKQLDPLSVAIDMDIGWTYYFERDFKQARRAYQQALELEPNYPLAFSQMAASYLADGNLDKAVEAAKKAIELGARTPTQLGLLAASYARSGRRADALPLLDELMDGFDAGGDESAIDLAVVYNALGKKDKALEMLDSAYEKGNSRLRLIQFDPVWDGIRLDSRFVKIVRKLSAN